MSAEATDPGWFYSRSSGPPGEQAGPVPWQQLVAFARGGYLAPDDLVWSAQFTTWQRAADVPGLFADVPPPPAAPFGPEAQGATAATYAPPAAAYAAAPPAQDERERRRSGLLYWLIPLIAVVVI